MDAIEKHRSTYPLPFDQISKLSSFEQVLGKTSEEYSEQERKLRWQKVLSFDREVKRIWSDTSECIGCVHLSGSWCNMQGLPCCVNPILSFNHGMIGMACMGLGYEEMPKQLQLSL
ncbi:MAG: hypothetical protein A2W90_18165 [Bacteroidetes bacterium GWF2_42_66]|nr:MAG: hypothetical protein A2W92_06155 [Bacteroidetes bacterium GWA2_42_15]OFX98178.1 MAG: hypothetical protein A2W89_09655 [Bacteroidetes bacterium GWE2_42_39]OFY42563.1 MAG: hypothetical protein A2W90_18165 [Bacteroidetes bacterium GWF2_42_66]HBL74279.1 hypothetical protein [Prolixibacteraceae bacterium]HCR92250.1 hypothetical protein [Prolixibacteraceae bacterium]